MKWQYGFILAIMLGFTQTTGAFTRLSPEQSHFISIDGSFGYASLTNDSPDLKAGQGMATNIGVGYRFFYNTFLLSTGVEGYYLLNTQSMYDVKAQSSFNIYPFPSPKEKDPLAVTLYLNTTDGSDICHSINLNIPILLGMEYKRFYFLVGPKFSVNFWGQAKTQATVTASGDFSSQFIMPQGMVNDITTRNFGPRYVESGGAIKWDWDVIAHVEVGGRFVRELLFQSGADIPKPRQRYYLALYIDYGIKNIHTSEKNSLGPRLKSMWDEVDLTTVDPNSVEPYTLTPAVMSNELGSAKIHQFSIGIKATVLIELPQKKACVICKE